MDGAFLCKQCLQIVTGPEAIWSCDCEDIETRYGAPSDDEIPESWIKGRIAFFPWKEEG